MPALIAIGVISFALVLSAKRNNRSVTTYNPAAARSPAAAGNLANQQMAQTSVVYGGQSTTTSGCDASLQSCPGSDG